MRHRTITRPRVDERYHWGSTLKPGRHQLHRLTRAMSRQLPVEGR